MSFWPWLLRLANVVPSEERDGIHMIGPCWEVHGQVDPCAFLRALPSVVPEDAILFLEGGHHPPALRDFIQANAVPAPATVRRGTVWPRETVFHLPATPEVLTQLAELAEHCAGPEICSHLHVYRGRAVLVEWHDAFDPPFFLSKALCDDRLRSFRVQLNVTLHESIGHADLSGKREPAE